MELQPVPTGWDILPPYLYEFLPNCRTHPGYNRLARPVQNISEPVRAELGVSLISIADVDKDNAVFTMMLWTKAVGEGQKGGQISVGEGQNGGQTYF